jgi:TetR/AcrR family transcriptional regulator, copper-responsive repressor
MEIAPTNPRPRGRPRTFDREAALDRAMRLFWTRGFEAVSIHDLEAELGITAPSLYAAFGDKKQLFRETIDRYRAGPGNLGQAMTGKATAREAIAALLLTAAETYTDRSLPPGCMVIHSGVNCSTKSDDIAAELAGIRRNLESAMAGRIAEGQRNGDVESDVNPLETAAYFAAVLQGMSTHARDGGSAEILRAIALQALKSWQAQA